MLSLSAKKRSAIRPTPSVEDMFDRRGQRRSPVTLPSYRRGRPAATKGITFPPEVLTSEEVFRLILAAGRGPCAGRNQALVVVGARAGLRCAEALDLYPKDVDLEHGRIQVLHGKGNKRRVVALDAGARAFIARWMDERLILGIARSSPLFCVIVGPTRGEKLHGSEVRGLMQKWGRAAGIEKHVHYHGLRHSYASYLLDEGVPIHFIKRMLGHSSIAMTEHYADHISPSRVIQFLHAMDWPEIHSGGLPPEVA